MKLVLHVTGEYYDQLAKGTKNVEYRALMPYWIKRIKGPIEEIHFYRGYPKKGTKPLVRKVADIEFNGETKQIEFILEPIHPSISTRSDEEKKCLLADDCPRYDPENVLCNTPLGGNLCDHLKTLDDEDP
jgi:hypothetical protein